MNSHVKGNVMPIRAFFGSIDNSARIIKAIDTYPESIPLCVHQGLQDAAVWVEGNLNTVRRIQERLHDKVELYTYEAKHNLQRTKARGEIMRLTMNFIEKYTH